MAETADAVVIGAGHNGLVAANMLADAGWDVLVLEGQPEPGGAVRSAAWTAPGFVTDTRSAFYPFGAASPVLHRLRLDEHGLVWAHAPVVLAHPSTDGRCAVLSRDLDETAASLDSYAPGDGDVWRGLYRQWERVGPAVLEALFAPFPPVRGSIRVARELGGPDLLRFARFALTPVRRVAEEEFTGAGGGLLLAGNALHADLAPESVSNTLYAWLLAMVGQQHGFPVPRGGAGELTAALVRRLARSGGRLECTAAATRVVVRDGRAVAVRVAGGREIGVRRAVLADVVAPTLYGDLVGEELLPPRLVEDLRRFHWDPASVKLDRALSGPIPWTAASAQRAGTVHLAASMDELTLFTAQQAMGQIPSAPFVLLGQMTTADDTRSPTGTQSAWAYTHVPREVRGDAGAAGLSGKWDERELAMFAERIEARVEAFAPGLARHILSPRDLQAGNPSLVLGAINGGTAALHQQLVFRPTPGLGRAETPIRGLYLASMSAHPGGGVHGGPGSNAARAALAAQRPAGRLASKGILAAGRWLSGGGS